MVLIHESSSAQVRMPASKKWKTHLIGSIETQYAIYTPRCIVSDDTLLSDNAEELESTLESRDFRDIGALRMTVAVS